MSTTLQTPREFHGNGDANVHLDTHGALNLAEALGMTLDSLAVGIVIVAANGQIVHANQAAKHMLETKSPILSHGGCLAALDPEATRELRKAVAAASFEPSNPNFAAIGVPLVEQDMSAATAHVLPLARTNSSGPASAAAAVFVTRSATVLAADVGILARIFGFTPAETRLLKELIAGASLIEAAGSLGITEATAKTHRNHIFIKAGVSRRTDLLALVGKLLPPIRRVQDA